ncbi:hypothetical protein SCLCIDRAFT_105458 [Scleroderma citrinum Foug A]|uniref:hAT-like transposase RNase-H fold domain-containing protein n=1 Tax=Scleroderma citrinum Foug A TaxID=1036808 RepID=A0A0C3EK86_9AGAM|nr:hypothetical protein SCLCIDRAFT_105458 [Scleroderma citrinum Foug A]
MQSLSLRSALIAFHRICRRHTGESLRCTILYLLDQAGITTKTGHFTLNNAENNVKMMEHLEKLLMACELHLEFNVKDRWIMCFPHIINICVQHVVDEFSVPDLKKIAQAWVDCFNNSMVDKKKYLEAVKRNLVPLGRDIIRTICACGVSQNKQPQPTQQRTMKRRMSSELQPILSRAMPTFELFMTGWEKLCELNKHIAPFIEVCLEWAKLYYSWMDNTRAYIIAMCESFWIKRHWEKYWISHTEDIALALMKEYHDMKIPWPEELQCLSEPDPYNVLAQQVGAMDMSAESSTPSRIQDVDQEYRAYIDGELLNKKQDPLKFWEVWTPMVPTIRA